MTRLGNRSQILLFLSLAWLPSDHALSSFIGPPSVPTTFRSTILFSSKRPDSGNRSPYQGFPSSPGWKSGQLETLIEWAVNDEANRPIIREYDPDPFWLWTRWNGTVLKLAVVPVLFNIVVGIGVDVFVHKFAESSWPLMSKPPADDPLIQQLEGLNKLWGYQVTLTTFILTFFTGKFLAHWSIRTSNCLWNYSRRGTPDW